MSKITVYTWKKQRLRFTRWKFLKNHGWFGMISPVEYTKKKWSLQCYFACWKDVSWSFFSINSSLLCCSFCRVLDRETTCLFRQDAIVEVFHPWRCSRIPGSLHHLISKENLLNKYLWLVGTHRGNFPPESKTGETRRMGFCYIPLRIQTPKKRVGLMVSIPFPG